MRTHLPLPAICLLIGVLLSACNAEPGATTDRTDDQLQENRKEMNEASGSAEAFREERTEAIKELQALREDLFVKAAREEERLDEGIENITQKAEREVRLRELNANIARVDTALARIDASTEADWTTTKGEARRTVDDALNWIQREAEKVDWNTKADADKDGH